MPISGLEISALPLAQASVKTVGQVKIMDHSPGLASMIFISSIIFFKISVTFTFHFKIIHTVHKPIAYQYFEISNKAAFKFVNRQKWLPFGDCYMMDVPVQSNISGHKHTNSSTEPRNAEESLFPDFPASFSAQFRHFACKLQEFGKTFQIKN